MKHIYSRMCSATLAFALLAATGCSDDLTGMDEAPEQKPAGKLITITATQETKSVQTRLGYDEQANGTVDVTWAKGDVFYTGKADVKMEEEDGEPLYPNEYWQTFTLNEEDAGRTSANFMGEAASDWQDNDQLYAVYGSAEKENISLAELDGDLYGIFSYNRQQQTDNADKGHLIDYDYMYATTTYSTTSMPNFSFTHTGSLMKFTLTLPEEAAGKKINKMALSTMDGEGVFIEELAVSLNNGTKLAGEPTPSISLSFYNEGSSEGISPDANKILTAYMMVAPTSGVQIMTEEGNLTDLPTLQGKEILLTVVTDDNYTYATKLTGSPIEESRFYTVEATLEGMGSFFDGGDGTEGNPYQIKDAGQLKNLATLVNSEALTTSGQHFKLTATEIDLQNEEWTPIGSGTYFKGTFDGNGCTIKNLKIDNTKESDQGLFGKINYATVKNLKVEGSIKGNWYVGGIAGTADSYSYLIGCSFAGDISGNYCVGGIAGYSRTSYFMGCCKTGSTTATTTDDSENRVGGIAGYMESSYATGCYNTGDVTVTTGSGYSSYIGGISGYGYGNLFGCYNTGSVTWTGDDSSLTIGGLLGNGYATGCSWIKSEAANSATNGIGSLGFEESQVDPATTINDADGVAALNGGIVNWNSTYSSGPQGDTTSPMYCNFHYEVGTDAPVLKTGAPEGSKD